MRPRKLAQVLLVLAVISVLFLLSLRASNRPAWNGKPVTHWIRYLRFQSGSDDCTIGARGILEIGPAAIPYLEAGLHQRDTPLSRGWAKVYPKLPPAIQKRFDLPVTAASYRYNCAYGLELLGVQASNTVPMLSTLLNDPDPWVRTGAASALGEMGPFARPVVQEFRQTIAKTNVTASFRLACVVALKKIMRNAPETVDTFAPILNDPDYNFRSHAAMALATPGTNKAPAVALLTAALRDSHATVQGRAASSLGQLGSAASSAVPALLTVLHESLSYNGRSEVVAWKVIEALGAIGPAATSALPALTNLFRSEMSLVGVFAASAASKIVPGHSESLQILREKLKSREQSERFWAVIALGDQRELAAPALSDIDQLELTGSTQERIMAAVAAWKIDPGGHTNPTWLIGRELKGNFAHQYQVLKVLGQMGPAGREAIPALQQARKQCGDAVREAVDETLAQIAEKPAH